MFKFKIISKKKYNSLHSALYSMSRNMEAKNIEISGLQEKIHNLEEIIKLISKHEINKGQRERLSKLLSLCFPRLQKNQKNP